MNVLPEPSVRLCLSGCYNKNKTDISHSPEAHEPEPQAPQVCLGVRPASRSTHGILTMSLWV